MNFGHTLRHQMGPKNIGLKTLILLAHLKKRFMSKVPMKVIFRSETKETRTLSTEIRDSDTKNLKRRLETQFLF